MRSDQEQSVEDRASRSDSKNRLRSAICKCIYILFSCPCPPIISGENSDREKNTSWDRSELERIKRSKIETEALRYAREEHLQKIGRTYEGYRAQGDKAFGLLQINGVVLTILAAAATQIDSLS